MFSLVWYGDFKFEVLNVWLNDGKTFRNNYIKQNISNLQYWSLYSANLLRALNLI